MASLEAPQSLTRKPSIFRRLSRKESSSRYGSARPSPNGQSQSTKRRQQHTNVVQSGLPTPPQSPKVHTTEIVKPASLKPDLTTHFRQIEVTSRPSLPCHDSQQCLSHFSHRVLYTALPTTPFPGTPLIRPWDIFLPPSQIFSLYLGALPQNQSDRWFIYSEGPDQAGKLKIHFHRSWTGMKIAELFVVMDVKGEGAGKLVGIKWNGSADTNHMTEREAKYMIRTTCEWTLGVQLERAG